MNLEFLDGAAMNIIIIRQIENGLIRVIRVLLGVRRKGNVFSFALLFYAFRFALFTSQDSSVCSIPLCSQISRILMPRTASSKKQGNREEDEAGYRTQEKRDRKMTAVEGQESSSRL